MLLDALLEPDGAGFDARWQALSTLLAVWARGRPGLEQWIAEFEAMFPAANEQLGRMGHRQVVYAARAARGHTDT